MARNAAVHRCCGSSGAPPMLADWPVRPYAGSPSPLRRAEPGLGGRGSRRAASFDSWVRYWKSQFTKHHGRSSANGRPIIGPKIATGKKATLTSGSTCAQSVSHGLVSNRGRGLSWAVA